MNAWFLVLRSLQKPVGSPFRRGKNILTAARCLQYIEPVPMGITHADPAI
jgi:hypothetical protein